jgi:hypothetical protein
MRIAERKFSRFGLIVFCNDSIYLYAGTLLVMEVVIQ